ncbi:hypothetical protein [Helicobacter felis]|uniref:hypothetical protein n=1 Tax=Helicobacter felis TaxID=214 RepID=UPI000EF674D9|nr:hypothetical protein [Helicobacter felis]
MDKAFIKKALHVANTNFVAFSMFVTTTFGIRVGSSGQLLGIIFILCLSMGAIILVLCPNKRISLRIIALGFVLCCCVFTPPIKYMGHILLSVGALIFWACFGDKKWWLFPIPLSIGIVFCLLELYGLNIVKLKWMLLWYSVPFFSVLCTYPICRNTPWYEVCSTSIFILFWVFLFALLFKASLEIAKYAY